VSTTTVSLRHPVGVEQQGVSYVTFLFRCKADPEPSRKWRHSLGRFLPDELTGWLYLLIEANSNETMLEDEDFPAV